jgi:hypothetical protein
LQTVILTATQVTAAGATALKKDLPACNIYGAR